MKYDIEPDEDMKTELSHVIQAKEEDEEDKTDPLDLGLSDHDFFDFDIIRS